MIPSKEVKQHSQSPALWSHIPRRNSLWAGNTLKLISLGTEREYPLFAVFLLANSMSML